MLRKDIDSNDHLTAQTRILFYVKKMPMAESDLLTKGKQPRLRVEILGSELLQDIRDQLQPQIREFRPNMLTEITGRDQKILNALRLLRLSLSHPAKARAILELYEAACLLLPKKLVSTRERLALIERSSVLRLYIRLVRSYLKGARLTLTAPDGEPAVAILCADLFTAAVVFSVYEQMAVCPGCGKVFAPSSERNQKFCSKNCGQRIYQQRYRDRQKAKKQRRRRP